jgi:Xaa-Pro aminopeptidase
MVDLGPVLRNLRLIKSPREIEFLRLAGRQADGAFKTAVSLLRVGQSELELAIRIEAYMRRKGHPGVLRVRRAETEIGMGVIMAGSSVPAQPEFDSLCFGRGLSPAVPFGPGDREIHAGEAVLFDYCGCCAGYLVDQSRMLSPGKPPDEASWAYEAMRQVLRRVEERLEPGQETGKLYEIACREAKMLGYEDQFMGSDRTRLTFVGHGVGLELDEPPFIAKGRKEILAPGMTMAIEPKVLLPGIGVVGIENTYLVTANGFERLTAAGEEWREVPLD